jgi:hypothetical protein
MVELPESYSSFKGKVKCLHCFTLWELEFSYGLLKGTPKLLEKGKG